MKVDIPADIMLQLAETELEAEVNKVLEKYGIGASIAVKIIEAILVKKKARYLPRGSQKLQANLTRRRRKIAHSQKIKTEHHTGNDSAGSTRVAI